MAVDYSSREQNSCGSRQLRLSHLELEGFKSFRDKTVIGPLADFTCIVGPNGCGKSVVGEAIAFALGGTRKMLRAGSLANLVNHESRAAGCRTAQVTLRLEVLPASCLLVPASPSSAKATAAAPAPSSTMQSPPPAADRDPGTANGTDLARPPAPSPAAAEALRGHTRTTPGAAAHSHGSGCTPVPSPPQCWLAIRRTLRGDTTKTHIKRPDSTSWTLVNQAELQSELSVYGINTQAVDRFIVAQSRQAVEVGDAVGLVRHLELLTGSGDYEARIEQQGQHVEQLAGSIDKCEQQISSLESEREALAPHVAHWQAVQRQEAQLLASRLLLLQDQQGHGTRWIQRQHQQLRKANTTASAAVVRFEELAAHEGQLQQQKQQLSRELQDSKGKAQSLKKKAAKLSAAAAASKVQLSFTATAIRSQQGLAQKLQNRLSKLQAEEAQHKRSGAEWQRQLQQLQEQQAYAEQRLAAARQAARDELRSLGAASAAGARCRHQGAAAAAAPAGLQDHRGGQSKQGPSQELRVLQQQLAAAEAQLAELQGVQSAAAAKATRAAASVAGLRTSMSDAETEAARSSQQLQLAVAALQQAAAELDAGSAAVQQAEKVWKDAHVQQRTLKVQLQQAQAEKQHLQNPQHPSVAAAAHPSAVGNWPAYDAAVQQLKQRSDRGQLPGRFYGRLCNLLSIQQAQGAAAVAVNVALAEAADLNRTLLVSDRPTAAAVIEHFKQHRVGTVQCKILSEAPGAGAAGGAAAAPAAGGHCSSTNRQLLDCVNGAPDVPGLQGLLQQLLGSWLLLDSRGDASRLLHLRSNLVTQAGEVFKADGEVVVHMPGSNSSGSSRGHSAGAYSLLVGAPAAFPAGPAAASSAAAAHNAVAAAAADAAQQRVQQLEKQAAAATKAAAAADQQLRAARESLVRQQQQLTLAKRAEQHACSQQQAETSRAAQLLPQLQRQLVLAEQQQQAADAELELATTSVQQAQLKQQQLEQKQQRQQADERSASQAASAHVAVGATGNSALQQAQEAAAAAAAAVMAAWEEADKAKQLQQVAGRKAAAVSKELTRVQSTGCQQEELEKLQAKLDSEEQQLVTVKSQLESLQAKQAEFSGSLKPLQQQLAAAGKATAAAQIEADASKALLQQEQGALHDLQQQQQQRSTAMLQLQEQCQQQPETAAADTGAAAAACVPSGTAAGSQSQQEDSDMPDVSGEQLQQQDMQVDDDKHREPAATAGHQGSEGSRRSTSKRRPAGAAPTISSRRRGTSSSGSAQPVQKRQQACQGARRRDAKVLDSSSDRHDGDRDSRSSGNYGGGGFLVQMHRRGPGKASSAAAGSCNNKDRCAAALLLRNCRQQHKQEDDDKRDTKESACGSEVSVAALAKQGQRLQQRQQQLDNAQQELQLQAAKVNEAALEQDLQALQLLAAAHAQLLQLQQQHDEAAAVREGLLDERFAQLLAVLQALNAALEGVYRQLTGGCGSAYCAYTQERRLLFSQGVTLHVQPDGQAWRQFGMLSGGQQALATLALSFALQAMFPSPFYFFDEVDCALDSLAAGRVAAFVRAQCSGSGSSRQLGHGEAAAASAAAAAAANAHGCDVGTGAASEGFANDISDVGGSDVGSRGGPKCCPTAGVGAQYLLVSHRPVVFESASCLLGVYSNGRGSSAAVVAHF